MGNGISDKTRDGALKFGEWMQEHPDELRESIERDRREWPKKRRKAVKYFRALNRKGVADIPDGLSKYDIERARREINSVEYRRERRWSAVGKIASVAAIVGAFAAVATLVITIILGLSV